MTIRRDARWQALIDDALANPWEEYQALAIRHGYLESTVRHLLSKHGVLRERKRLKEEHRRLLSEADKPSGRAEQRARKAALCARIVEYAKANPTLFQWQVAEKMLSTQTLVSYALREVGLGPGKGGSHSVIDVVAQKDPAKALLLREEAIKQNWLRWEFTLHLAAHFAKHTPCPNKCPARRCPPGLELQKSKTPWEGDSEED